MNTHGFLSTDPGIHCRVNPPNTVIKWSKSTRPAIAAFAGAVSSTRSEIAIQRRAKGFGYTNCISLGSRLIKTIKCSQLFEINFESVWIKKWGIKKRERERSLNTFFFFCRFCSFSSLLSTRKEQEKRRQIPPLAHSHHREEHSPGEQSCASMQYCWFRAELGPCWPGVGVLQGWKGYVGSLRGSSGFPPLTIPVCPRGPS